MTCEESVKRGLTIFYHSKCAFKCSFVILIIIIIFEIVSLAIGEWIINDSRTEGLWNTCYTVGNATCCTSIKDVPAFLGATRAFMIMAVLLLPLMFLLRCCEMNSYDDDSSSFFSCQVMYSCLTVFAVIFLLLASSIYGGMYEERNVKDSKLSMGFALCTTGMLMLIIEGIIVCVYVD